MRYFIAHLPKGPIEKYHYELVQEVAERFNLSVSAGYFPTHITLKAPFETNNIAIVKNRLEKFATSECSQPFGIYKFGHFNKDVVFLDVDLPQKTAQIVIDLQHILRDIPELSWSDYEPQRNFHITIAKKNVTQKFNDIWKYLQNKPSPNFDLSFDNIALLRRENDKWVVDTTYMLNP